MDKISLFFLLFIFAGSSFSLERPHAFGYESTKKYLPIIKRLERDPHPWAKPFIGFVKQVEKENRKDLERLLNENNALEQPFDEEAFKNRLKDLLEEDKNYSRNLLDKLNQSYKPEVNWPLFTGLKKMIGNEGPGIYDDSWTFVLKYPYLFDGQADLVMHLYDNQVTVAKNALIYALKAKTGQNELLLDLAIIHPTALPKDPSVRNEAQLISLYNPEKGVLYKPSASYEFGANPKDTKKNIWDCSSFVSLVIGSEFRLSTVDFEDAYHYFHGQLAANERIVSILKQVEVIELPATKLEFMDIVVWRGKGKGGGHVAFYLGNAENGHIIIGDSNRSDKKDHEGTGITTKALYKENMQTYAFRMRDARL